ncbi:calcium/sodium antiporter [Pontibacillus yanchengensis]|uniref:Calcium/sodium antiporter n=2 Tax=Pontibacillus yanchengensis TaxID=462910 RepID=A0ACC7VIA6_9BACI|nr:calcium/sodium antiporter [Pontibacillus yanchengensis]MYL34925.1 calcium/sodium antiporter [Pontibacillus yanchengensis]MYL54701.1 calcium/sodium antiporter [Pontibacillus yanchengensis]
MVYIFLVVGFVLLIKGANLFVDGSSNIARSFQVSPLLIGLTIVAFGTSSPEATVSIIAALEENAGVALGNVVGSNILNITLVVGVAAFIYPLKVESETIRKEIPFTLLASVALLILISDVLLQTVSENLLTRGDGFIIMLFFMIFLYYIFEVARNSREKVKSETKVKDSSSWKKNIIYTIGGLVGIIFGGELVVKNATEIAFSFGMSETLIGLTIVAIGTSLPELITSITAALKKESEIALGNIVGSNIFNILFVLGVTAVIHPLAVNGKIIIDIIIMILLTGTLLLFSRTNYKIGKFEGMFLVIVYIIYMIFIIIRN